MKMYKYLLPLSLGFGCLAGCRIGLSLRPLPALNAPEGFAEVHRKVRGLRNIEVKLGQVELGQVLSSQTISIDGVNYPGRIIQVRRAGKPYQLRCYQQPHQLEECALYDSSGKELAHFSDALGHLLGELTMGSEAHPVINNYGPENHRYRTLRNRTLTKVFGSPPQAKLWFSNTYHRSFRYWEAPELSESQQTIFQIFSALLIQNEEWNPGLLRHEYPFEGTEPMNTRGRWM